MNRWKPNVTVATVVERQHNGQTQYLCVHELRDGRKVYNQPAGHLDEGESLVAAAKRETLEETGWNVEISHLIGIYRFIAPNGITYLRHAFAAQALTHNPQQKLDEGILAALWLSYDEILANSTAMRSKMVQQTIDDYRQGHQYPLSLLHEANENR